MPRVSHMVLPVSDLQRARDWYVAKLGFAIEREQDDVLGIKDASGLTIFLRQESGSLAGCRVSLTIEVDDVDAKYRELHDAGVEFSSPPMLQFWGYGAEVLDPDGYVNHLWDPESMQRAMRQ